MAGAIRPHEVRVSGQKREMKNQLRQQLRERLETISASQREKFSEQVYARLQKQSAWQEAKSVLFFAPHSSEPDIWPLISAALAQKKIVTFPKFVAGKNSYIACRIENSDRDFQRGQFGIREPNAASVEIPLNCLDLALVPGIGFDLMGRRLGRGKGFYDRLLAQIPGTKCGVCFDEQIVETIPTEPHDVRLNYILTPTRWHEVKPA